MKKNQSLEKLIAARNQPFKYAVFSGGGAKGNIYSGVHEAMVNSGILEGLEAIAGSSSGAITASLIATGISTENFKRLSKETDLPNLFGKGFIVNKDGKPLYQLIKNTTSSNILNYFEANDIIEICNKRKNVIKLEINKLLKKSDSQDLEKIEDLKQKKSRIETIISHGVQELYDIHERIKSNSTVYFRDLDIMHLIDPAKFKDLVVTAVEKETGELTIFDARKTPYVEIALAIRASASIPIVFEPVEIDGKVYVDGSYRANIPQKYFSESEKETDIEEVSNSDCKIKQAKKQKRILALAFSDDERGYNTHIPVYSAKEKITDPGRVRKFLTDVIFKMLSKVGGDFKYSEEEEKTYQALRENALNTVILDTKDVGTLSFQKAYESAEYLHIKGLIQTQRHFENHDIGQNTDPNLARKEFMLKIYEDTQQKSMVSSLKDKVLGIKEAKFDELLQFCKADTWEGKAPENVIASFIAVSAKNRIDGSYELNTETMQQIVSVLNDPTTPTSIKSDFAIVLRVDIKQSPGQSRNDALLMFKFEPEHFLGIIEERNSKKIRTSEPATHKVTMHRAERSKFIDSILINSPKKLKADQIVEANCPQSTKLER